MSTVTIGDDEIKDRHAAPTANFARSKMAQRVLAVKAIPLTRFRVWDAQQTNLPGTGATDDLALITGTLGTDAPTIQTGDVKALGATPRYAKVQIQLPEDYEAGETVTIRVAAGMKTTIADVSATVDIQAYRQDGAGAVGADICATAARSCNSLSLANKDFVITPATLGPGDILDVRLAIATNDAATVTAVIGMVAAVSLLADLR